MVSKDHNLSVRRQCGLLLLARSNLYYHPKGESAENLRFMEIIDKQFLNTPWYGSRQMARYMQRQGHKCGRHRVRRLMRLMRLVPIYQTPNTSKKAPAEQDLPIFVEKVADHKAQPGLVRRHHLHSHAAWVLVFGCHHGLVQPQGFELAVIQ